MIQRIKEEILRANFDAADNGEKLATKQAIETCLKLSELLDSQIGLVSGLKLGVFIEEDCGISLVIQSLTEERRLSCGISSSGKTITSISTFKDKGLVTQNIQESNISQTDYWLERARWIIGLT